MAVKTHRGGKYGTGVAGTPHELTPKEAGTKREFIGSDEQEWTFAKKGFSNLIVKAKTLEEARRIARARGYTRLIELGRKK